MAKLRVVLTERPDSRRGTIGVDASFELRYNAVGSSDIARVRTAAQAQLPSSWEGLVLTNIIIEPDPNVIDTIKDKGIWLVVGDYRPPLILGLAGVEQSFDTSGATFHITQSLLNRERSALPGRVPTDHKGAINAIDGKVEGVDIIVPTYNFTETYQFSPAIVTPSYKIVVFNLTGKTNDGLFRGFIRGEVLFMGASGKLDQSGFYQVEFRFAASPQLSNFKVGEIPITLKMGWDYIWVSYEPQTDDDSHKLALRPAEVYVEQLYREGDFGGLGLGTGMTPNPNSTR